MYYPVQIPYILSKEFSSVIRYFEETDPRVAGFAVCFWGMLPQGRAQRTVENVIITDGCVDLIADFNNRRIGFAGMSRTNFTHTVQTPAAFYGVRLKPGAFYALTGIPSSAAMDGFIPLQSFDPDFNADAFFSLPIPVAKVAFGDYIARLCADKTPGEFVGLFDRLWDRIPATAAELYGRLHFSPKQTQRLFLKHFGLTPQMALSILRFQKCLTVLTSGKAAPKEALGLVNFYDQAHFTNDFKRNLGITPFELVRRYTAPR